MSNGPSLILVFVFRDKSALLSLCIGPKRAGGDLFFHERTEKRIFPSSSFFYYLLPGLGTHNNMKSSMAVSYFYDFHTA